MPLSRLNETEGRRTVVGLGEGLFDVIAGEPHCGGAPLNFAVHAHQLGNEGSVVTRVGNDDLAVRLTDELARRGMTTRYVQVDSDRPTGTVVVCLDRNGQPSYEIVADVAWDALEFTPELASLAREADAVCFGTLGQRSAASREAIRRFLEAADRAERLLDVNLRPPFYDASLLARSCEPATAVKLNEGELRELAGLFGLSRDGAADGLRERFGLSWVAVSRGPRGTVVHDAAGRHESEPVAARTEDGDPVGAGDATAAALVHGAIRGWPWSMTLALANRLGAYVASCRGACPRLPRGIVDIRGNAGDPQGSP
jgi:fructokinase